MPLLDRHGKLFGRWNLIDVIAVAVALGLLWAGYATAQIVSGAWRRFPMRQTAFPMEGQATFVGLDAAVARLIHVGDAELDAQGPQIIAQIIEVGAPTPETVTVRYGDQDWVKQVSNPASGRVDVPVRMWIASELRGDALYFKNRLVGSGTRIGFATTRYQIHAIVYDEGWVDLLVRTSPLSLQQVQLLQQSVGGEELDLRQRPIARLLRIEDPIPVKSKQATPKQTDLKPHVYSVNMGISARCIFNYRGVLTFKGNPVVSNQALFFQFANLKFYGTVFEIHPLSPSALRVELNQD